MKKIKNQKGYIALSSVLIVSALVILIGVSTSLLSVNDLLSSFSNKKSNEVVDLTESCVEDVLLKLNEENVINNGTINLPGQVCNVTINSHTGNDWDFTVDANKESFYQSVRVSATRGSTVTISSWLDN
ncbi:MAG: hypothetical protein US62_C0024G0007 [Candidatus Woesebacteria bacterium GW2011_GWA1_37_8]|uniref:Uncharacterized protein n=2 Tax=Candidatus Woeseibacteriota TaxID=1752722 RepID=A0A0G0PCR9_9BACT|nr:MAG: hypothetical protein US39_C0003G0041 [Microgenomates group bacterium GW2011_GWC1_37_12b]KKQ44585.1 MAG: hypothetical protein US62_C0024G0007 [Candidatus Woesebacteria bacterium GW2011_GWA1_37_8]KKQ87076.1 MAG: hypothetical protein UT10_C0011G0007 [Candidatus Woesebacteria bacterium GW2011_GWB1_38_8b]